MSERIDISTHQLAEMTAKSFNGKLSLEQVLSIWKEIGQVVKSQLLQRKGVRLTNFGTFTFNRNGDPIFAMSTDMGKQFRLRQKVTSTPENIPTVSLNFSQIQFATKLSRELVEKVYLKFLSCMGRMIFEGRKIIVSIMKVAEIQIYNSELSYELLPDFATMFQPQGATKPISMNQIHEVAKNTTKTLKVQQATLRTMEDPGFDEEIFTGLMIGDMKNQMPKQQGLARRAQSAGRARNPITGEGGSEYGNGSQASSSNPHHNRRPPSASRPQRVVQADAGGNPFRRPGTANSEASNYPAPSTISTTSMMFSPRPNAAPVGRARSNTRGVGGGGGGGGGGLRKEDLDQHQKQQQQMQQQRRASTPTNANAARRPGSATGSNGGGYSGYPDARNIAAKALAGNGNAADVVARVRQKIIDRGGTNGIKSIAKLLSIMDDNGDKRLSKEEFKYGLRDYGINITPQELEQVFYYFDRDGNGFIDVTEFLVGLKGDLNPRRRSMVQMAFDLLDHDHSGVITVDEILTCYDLSWHPEVRAGKMTIKEATKDFMKTWDKVPDGMVSFEEFEDYYKELSASIDDDNYFELMIRNAWRIAGGEGMAANTANRRVLVTKKDGTQVVQTIEKELGVKANDRDEMRRRLVKQQGGNGDDFGDIELYGGYEDRQEARRPQNRPTGTQRNPNAAVVPSGGGGRSGRKEAWGESQQPQQQPSSNPFGRGGSSGGAAFPGRGDQSFLPPPEDALAASKNGSYDPYEKLRTLFYAPPCTVEALCGKLQVSSVTTIPRMPEGAFLKRLATLDPTLSKGQLRELWRVVDTRNAGYVDVPEMHQLLTNRYGKDKTAASHTGVIERVIKKILERCGETAGIKGLQRTLSVMDDSGDKKLSKDELKYGLQDYGIELNIREVEEIFQYFDRDRNGVVDIDEFLIGIKGDLSPRRKKMVKMAFDLMDTDGSGIISMDEMMHQYDFTSNPEVKEGKKSIQQAAKEFMKQWDHSDDGTVSFEEFCEYYKGVSASIDGDDYFELMIRNAWRIAGGEGMAANTANRRVLVTKKDGTQVVQTIEKELGVKANDRDEMRRRLVKQQGGGNGDDFGDIELYAGMDTRDKAKTVRQPPARFQPQQQAAQRFNATERPASRSRPSSAGAGNLLHKAAMNATRNGSVATPKGPAKVPTEFEKHQAATKLAAVFRARKAQRVVEHEKRKVNAQREASQEDWEEQNRPKPRDIVRPKGKSYIGF